MSEIEKGQVMTANRLRDGEVVFLTRSGEWNEKIDEAVLALEPQATAALEARAKEDVKATLVTGTYLFDAERVDGNIRAASYARAHPHAWSHGHGLTSASRPKARPAHSPLRRLEPCIAMMNSTINSCANAPRNSATRPTAASAAS